MVVGHQKKIECMIARSGSDIDKDDVRMDVLKMANQTLFLGIRHVGSGQGIAGAGDDPQVGMKREPLSHGIQLFDSMSEKVGQGYGRVEEAKKDMGISPADVQVREHYLLALSGEEQGQIGCDDTLSDSTFS